MNDLDDALAQSRIEYDRLHDRIRALEAALAEERGDQQASAARRRLAGKIGAQTSWANTTDRTARTAPARSAFDQKFLDQADGDPVRAAHLKKAHFARLALKSAEARRKKRESRDSTKAEPS